jgi:hypothetical protein
MLPEMFQHIQMVLLGIPKENLLESFHGFLLIGEIVLFGIRYRTYFDQKYQLLLLDEAKLIITNIQNSIYHNVYTIQHVVLVHYRIERVCETVEE